ncbi:hypothetical protein Tco_0638070 [Tanacetum coccineum]
MTPFVTPNPLDSLKSWNDHFFWVDAFACPASFPWNTIQSLPSLMRNIMLPLLHIRLRSIKIDLLSFIQTTNPTKVRVGERQRAKDESKLLDTTVGCVVPLLPIAPAHAESKLDASVDRLFYKGGSGNLAEQGDSASGGHGVGIPLVSEAAETVVEDVAPVQPRRQRKRKTFVPDAGGPSHPPKKLREDHGTLSVTSVGGKSRSAVQWLLAGAMQNAEVRVEPIPTLPFVTSSISAMPKREDEVHTDSTTGLNLRTIGALQRFVISSDSSHHFGVNIAEAEVDSFVRPSVSLMTVATTVTSIVDPATTVKEKFVESFIFGGDSSGGGADHTVGGFSDLTGSDFIIGGIRTIISPDTDLQKVYVPQWSVTNGSRLDDVRTCREMVDEFAPPKFFASIRGMEHNQLFTEFNVGVAHQMSPSAEVRMRAEYNIRERRRLNSVVEEKNSLLKARDVEIETLKAQLLMKEAEAIRLRTEATKFEVVEKSLRDEVNVLKEQNTALEQESTDLGVKVADLTASVKVREQEVANLDVQVTFAKSQSDNLVGREKVTTYENCIGKLEEFQDEQIRVMNDNFEKLYVDFVVMALHLEEKFYPHLLTTIAGRRWLLTYGVKLAIIKCLHSPEYLSALGAAISRAIEKGMQDGLANGITHGQEGRVLTDIAAFNPSTESDYISALQELQDVNFSLLAELKSNKDVSTETLMNILRLDEPLAEILGLDESQSHVDQFLVPIHHSPDRTIIGATSLLFSLDVSCNRVQKIRDNIANHRSDLRDVFVLLVEPLSSAASRDDYDVVYADGQEGRGAANPFPNVDDAELNID